MLHLLGPASRGHVGPKGMFRSVRVWVSSWPCEGFFTSEFKQTYAFSLCRTQKGMQYVQTMRSIVVCRPQETHLKPTSLPKFSYECMSFHPSSKLTQLRPIRCYFVLKIPCWSRLEWPLSGNCPKSVSRKSDLDRDFAPLKGKRTRIYIYIEIGLLILGGRCEINFSTYIYRFHRLKPEPTIPVPDFVVTNDPTTISQKQMRWSCLNASESEALFFSRLLATIRSLVLFSSRTLHLNWFNIHLTFATAFFWKSFPWSDVIRVVSGCPPPGGSTKPRRKLRNAKIMKNAIEASTRHQIWVYFDWCRPSAGPAYVRKSNILA